MTHSIHARLLVTACIWLAIGSTCRAQLTTSKSIRLDDGGTHQIQHFLSTRLLPKPIDRRARQTSFYPRASELSDRNAATFYYRAGLFWQQRPLEKRQKLFFEDSRWFGPIADFPRQEVEQYLGITRDGQLATSFMQELETAWHSSECLWDILPDKNMTRDKWFNTLLPEYDLMRQFARVNYLIGFIAILDGDQAKVESCIQNGFKMAHDIGQIPSDISHIYARDLAGIALKLAVEWSATVDAPNLMYGYQSIPISLSPREQHRQASLEMIRRSCPLLVDDPESPRSEAEWKQRFLESVQQLDLIDAAIHENQSIEALNQSREMRSRMLAARLYPVAKFELLQRDWKADQLDTMPPEQVIAIQTRYVFDVVTQPYLRLSQLTGDAKANYWEQFKESVEENSFNEAGSRGDFPIDFTERNVIADLIFRNQTQDFISLLIGVEATRDFLARNGSLPQSLEELGVVLELSSSPRRELELLAIDHGVALKTNTLVYQFPDRPDFQVTSCYFELLTAGADKKPTERQPPKTSVGAKE